MDKHVSSIEQMRDEGAVVVIKWDGERAGSRQTVIVMRGDTNFSWRADGDDLEGALEEAITAYRRAHDR